MKKQVSLFLSFTVLLLLTSLYSQKSTSAKQTSGDSVFVKHTVDNAPELNYIRDLVAIDIDNDQDIDIVGTPIDPGKIVWWENDGTPEMGEWIRHDIGTTVGSPNLATTDLDGDQDVDIVVPGSYTSNELLWFENDGSPDNGEWIEHVITDTDVDIHDVATADLDGDEDIDVVKMSQHTQGRSISWYENDGTPADGGWQEHVITYQEGANSIKTVDIDQDNDVDILVAAADNWGLWQRCLFYLRNDGGAGWSTQDLEYSISAIDMLDVDAGDVDNDGDKDVVAGYYYGGLYLYENDGTPSGWANQNIGPGYIRPMPIHFVDLDNDLDLDVVGTGLYSNEISWWQNDGSPWDGEWTKFVIEAPFDSPGNATVSDIDADGDLDIIGSDYSGSVFWWEQSIQFPIFLPLVTNQN